MIDYSNSVIEDLERLRSLPKHKRGVSQFSDERLDEMIAKAKSQKRYTKSDLEAARIEAFEAGFECGYENADDGWPDDERELGIKSYLKSLEGREG